MGTIQKYLDQLNTEQKEAVLENSHPTLVLAGAGSGKTRVITTKIAYALEVLGLQSWQILAVTFTNRAAKEMRDRVEQMAQNHDVSQMHIRTFHSFGAWLLRRYGQSIGLNSSFNIYDDEDSLSLLASCYPQAKRLELRPASKAISLAKDMGLSPQSGELEEFRNDAQFQQQFASYEQKLKQVGNVDFADLIVKSIELLKTDAEVRLKLQRQFKMILVDEYQDSNASQFELLQLLVGPDTYICVVGDDDQSIYRFRGAEIANILTFPDSYPHTKIVKLEQNYRSTQDILTLASAVIRNNTSRHAKELWTENTERQKVRLLYVPDDKTEARRVAMEILQAKAFDDTAVIYRTNAQSREFETLFTQQRIPYKVIGALRFYEREEIKDALALLYVLINPFDEVSFKRMVNKPARGLGAVSVEKIIAFAGQKGIDLLEALSLSTEENLISAKAASAAKAFATVFSAAKELLKQDNGAALEHLIRESSLASYYEQQDLMHATGKLDNLGTLVTAVGEYPAGIEGMVAFLESLSLDPTTIGHKDPSSEPGVSLITMHNTKGLEFERVFVTGMEEGLFPSRISESEADIEEERRLFYVAITRAKRHLVLTSSARRAMWGDIKFQSPSRFLLEIPPGMVEIEGKDEPRRPMGYGNIIRRGATVVPLPVKRFEQGAKKQGFSLGDRVYHSEYGEGEVQSAKTLRGKGMIEVQFANGQKISFFAENAVLEKVAID